MRSLQLALQDLWDFLDKSVSVVWTPTNKVGLLCWSDVLNLLAGVPSEPQHLDLLFWSDASDLGWGANLVDQFVSGLWSAEDQGLSINLRKLRAIRLGLQHFQHSLLDQSVGVFCDNMTASVLGGVPGHFSGVPVHHGGKKCGGRYPEPLISDSGQLWSISLPLLSVTVYWSTSPL